ncbi:hypothetical protein AD16_5535 [Escherichia coli 3-267-03_S4_C2]|nr:hypothetical protein AD16_5535 [Escherichia coli 3-267-03_S4_C2]KDX40618.1 hypothetical protein AC16_4909 [Escherichia coli 2-177-06_S3_C2]KEL75256.1 hypothetical protein AC22_5260 [Escherichia coli 5-366-08_S3_C2]
MFYLLRVQEIVRIPKTANNLGVDSYNARTPLQGSLLPLTRLVWA